MEVQVEFADDVTEGERFYSHLLQYHEWPLEKIGVSAEGRIQVLFSVQIVLV